MDDVVSITNHLVDHQSSILRIEFLTESKKQQFASHTRQVKCEWSINQKKYKMITEQDTPSSDRLSKQPFYALIDIFRDILPQGEVGPNGELQTDINTPQVWPCKEATSVELLSQVSYVIDNCFFQKICLCTIHPGAVPPRSSGQIGREVHPQDEGSSSDDASAPKSSPGLRRHSQVPLRQEL